MYKEGIRKLSYVFSNDETGSKVQPIEPGVKSCPNLFEGVSDGHRIQIRMGMSRTNRPKETNGEGDLQRLEGSDGETRITSHFEGYPETDTTVTSF